MRSLAALIAVTAVWGVTFVQVKDAVELYPLFAFLAIRFAIASCTLAVPGARRLRSLGRRGVRAGIGAGAMIAAGYALQTAGLERSSVSSTGFITGTSVVLTPLFALALFRMRVARPVWIGVALATVGLAMLAGIHGGSFGGNALVLAGAAMYALQIVVMERYAPRYDAIAFTLVEMLAAFAGLFAIAVARGELTMPHGWTVWGALLVTGVFASALAFLVQTWAQRRASATQTALVFSLEPVWAAFFGLTLAGDRLGALGWSGCAVIMAGIVVAEPSSADVLFRLVRRPRMTAVLLAVASAALFGGMTVAVRLGLGSACRTRAALPSRPWSLRSPSSSPRRSCATTRTASGRSCSPVCSRPASRRSSSRLAVREVGASRTSVAIGAAPLVAIVIALVFLGEPLRLPLVFGAVAVVGGGVLLAAERDRPGHLRARGIALRGRRGDASSRHATTSFARCTGTQAPRLPRRRRSSPARSSRPCGRAGRRTRVELRRFAPAGVLFGLSYICLFEAYWRSRVTIVSPLVATESLFGVLLAALLVRHTEGMGRRIALGALLVVVGGAVIGAYSG